MHQKESQSKKLKIVLALFLVLLLAKKGFLVAKVHGASMKPTLQDGTYLLCVRIFSKGGLLRIVSQKWLIRRGAIVIARPPAVAGRVNIKRIAGVAGDFCSWGEALLTKETRIISQGHVFLVGDASRNFDFSGSTVRLLLPLDSRRYGPCPNDALIARAILRFYPLKSFGFLKNLLIVSNFVS